MLCELLSVFCGIGYLFFFFFKQKTAYEMRISDWSSDVCSSDLLSDGEGLVGGQVVHDDDVAGAERRHQDLLDIGEECDLVHRTVERHRGGDAAQAQGADEGGGLPVAVRDRSTAAFASERPTRSEEHTSELQSLMRNTSAVFCL